MTAPKICPECGAALDAGETCDCRQEEKEEGEGEKKPRRRGEPPPGQTARVLG